MKKKENKIDNKYKRASLFFGFYLIFFIFLFIYMKANTKENNEIKKEENPIISVDNPINELINSANEYSIIVNDNNEIVTIDDNYEYKYFLNSHNLNQLIKNSKLIKNDGNILEYELTNDTINSFLNTQNPSGINTISLFYNKSKLEKIILDLYSYMEKDTYTIIFTKDGDKNE